MIFSVPNKEYPKRNTYAISDHETERARYWLACIDYPICSTTLEIWITADQQYEALANGILQSTNTNDNGTKTVYWKLDQSKPHLRPKFY